MEVVVDYKSEYALKAYKVLSARALQCSVHVCSTLCCTPETYNTWYNTVEEFKNAVDLGLVEGEKRFRDKLRTVSMHKANKVNTKLLLELAADVYGWDIEDQEGLNGINPNSATKITDSMSEKDASYIYTNLIKGTAE